MVAGRRNIGLYVLAEARRRMKEGWATNSYVSCRLDRANWVASPQRTSTYVRQACAEKYMGSLERNSFDSANGPRQCETCSLWKEHDYILMKDVEGKACQKWASPAGKCQPQANRQLARSMKTILWVQTACYVMGREGRASSISIAQHDT